MNTVNQTLRFLVIFLSITTASLSILLAYTWIEPQTSTNATSNQIENIIKSFSLQEFPTDQELEEAKLKGIVLSLDDPFSEYLTPDESEEFQNNLNQRYEGIGIRFSAVSQGALIEEVFKDGPAAQNNLQQNDIITSVDQTSIAGFESEEISSLIRGTSGSIVSLEYIRDDINKVATIERGAIITELVTLDIRGSIAIISISSFGEDLGTKMDSIARTIRSNSQIERILIDVRGNGGGLLNESIEVISYFLNERSIVIFEKTNDDLDPVYSKSIRNSLSSYPVDVLIDGNSASASEIVAGSLQYHRGAQLFGRPSFGKGTVQRIFDLQNGGTLKLTVAEWLTPDEQKIPSNGYTPDVLFSEEDDILEKALEYLVG